MTVDEKKSALLTIINDAHLMLKSLQDECQHECGIYQYQSNTGNYHPQDDVYWRNHWCVSCDKQWREWSTLEDGSKNPAYTKALGVNWKEVK